MTTCPGPILRSLWQGAKIGSTNTTWGEGIKAMRALNRGLLLAAMMCLPCISGADPFRIPKQELVAKVHIIGILPTINGVNGLESATAAVDQRLEDGLRAAGFEVRDAGNYRDTEAETRREDGGWFDPSTGRADSNKRTAIMARAMQVYQSRYKADAFLRARIEEVPLHYVDEKHVQWDGVEENIVASESLIASINHAVGILDTGQFSVLRLVVGLYDTQGGLLYSAAGGIGARSVLVKKQFAPVDISSLLGDTARLIQAADIALRPLGKISASAIVPARSVSIGNLAAAASVDTHGDETPTRNTRTEIQKTVKTIAIVPIDLNGDSREESIRAIYHNRLAQCLQAAGYDVVSRWAMEHTFEDAAEQVGGIYDPVWGNANEQKLARVREIQTRALREGHHVDGLLYVSFPTVGVPFNHKGLVEWDGVSRSIFVKGYGMERGADFWGKTNAISMSVRLTDLAGKVLYSNRAGIELLSEFTGRSFVDHSWTSILEDEDKAIAPTKNVLAGLTDN
jgi:hypothetical protein